MSVKITIDIADYTTPQIKALGERLGDRKGMHEVLGRSLERSVGDHFASRQGERNKRGWPSQGFWARIHDATAFAGASDSGATVAVADRAFAAKVHGARIVPKEKKMLAIPLRAEVYGVWPRAKTIPGLFRWTSPRGNVFLAAPDKAGKALRIYWLLVGSANVPADPKAMPPDEAVYSGIAEALSDFLSI